MSEPKKTRYEDEEWARVHAKQLDLVQYEDPARRDLALDNYAAEIKELVAGVKKSIFEIGCSPEQRALMRTFYNTETLCRAHAADDDPPAPSVCKDAMDINADIWRTLESVGLCYGDDRTSRSDWRWTKCGPHSLHPKPGGPFLMDYGNNLPGRPHKMSGRP
jgi:hypothetical protein